MTNRELIESARHFLLEYNKRRTTGSRLGGDPRALQAIAACDDIIDNQDYLRRIIRRMTRLEDD